MIPQIKVICSASLSDKIYSQLDSLEEIREAIVYCLHLEGGFEVLKKYNKSERVITSDFSLIDHLTNRKLPTTPLG